MLPLMLLAAAAAEPAPLTSATVNEYSRCLAQTEPRLADRVFSFALFSDRQDAAIRQSVNHDATCVNRDPVSVRSERTLVSGLAEQLYLDRFGGRDTAAIVSRAAVTPRNASEDVALCIAKRNPSGARVLIDTEPGSSGEMAAIQRLTPDLGPCLPQEQTFTLDAVSIRTFAAAGLYLSARDTGQLASK